MTHKLRGVRVEEYAYHVKNIRQNVGLETDGDVKNTGNQIQMTMPMCWGKSTLDLKTVS